MNVQANQNSSKGSATVVAKAGTQAQKPPQTTVPTEPVEKEASPTFANLKSWLIGRDIVVYSAPKSDFTRTYCTPKTENDPGLFYCTLLDLSLDEKTNEPLFALIEYSEKNARKFYSVDILPLKGCSISVPMEMDLPKKAEDTADDQTKQ